MFSAMPGPTVSRSGGHARRLLVYVYHPIVTKLSISFLMLGLLLLLALRPEGRTALNDIHAVLASDLALALPFLALLFGLGTLSPFFPEFLVTVMAGFLLGVLPGGLFAVVAITLAASANFFIARRAGERVIRRHFDLHTRRELRWTATRVSRVMVFLTWLLPSINFDLISYAGGLSSMPYRIFLALTVCGNVLSALVLSFLGNALHGNAAAIAVITLLLYTLVGTLLYVRELPARIAGTPRG
jgi:uncharacterized membrane protein YdjX (TVP38/TMEM64 family)